MTDREAFLNMKMLVAAGLLLVLAGSGSAQDLSFDGVNQGGTAAAQPQAAITQPPALSSGQGAPYGYYNYSNSQYGYSQYYQLQAQFNAVLQQLSSARSAYGYLSGGSDTIDRQQAYGYQLWNRYSTYQDPNSAYQLEVWMSQIQSSLGGYQSGYTYPNYTYTYPSYTYPSYSYTYPTYSYPSTYAYSYSNYTLPQYSYYNVSSSLYYGGSQYYYPNSAYLNGVTLGNGIGNIVVGSRYNNGTQIAGGVLSTIGGVLSLVH